MMVVSFITLAIRNKKVIALTVRQQANRIDKTFNLASECEVEQGMQWYSEARQFSRDMANLANRSREQVAQLISLFSPKKEWTQNMREVQAFILEEIYGIPYDKGYFMTKRSMSEARDILHTDYRIPFKRTKTYSFADNIADRDSKEITIDRHAIKVAYGTESSKEILITDKRYRQAREAYAIVAEQHGLKGYELQAITWLTYKRIVNR